MLLSWTATIFKLSWIRQRRFCHHAADDFQHDSPLARRMSLHDGLTDLRNNHFTDSHILPCFQICHQASLRFYGPIYFETRFGTRHLTSPPKRER